ncbi:lysine-rich arabinogalactan protein 19-like [Panicum virgatum]|uniref:lysine-rich arabinogalactan protein 19-like n=1 Tax=Panicum virgatum TaxID=38727 RepID=UPI0019D5CC99|nr:lysine-rich arabinogalactan protein 19-like [Panicum virgatum]
MFPYCPWAQLDEAPPVDKAPPVRLCLVLSFPVRDRRGQTPPACPHSQPPAPAADDPRGRGPAAPRESLAAPVACSRSPRLLAPPTTRAAADPRRRGKVAHPDSAPCLLALPPSRSRPPARVAGRKGP